MGKQTKAEATTISTLRPKDKNWKVTANLKYLKYRNYFSHGRLRAYTSGLIDDGRNQAHIKIWGGLQTLAPNKTYVFSQGRVDPQGHLNFGKDAQIEQLQTEQQNNITSFYRVDDLAFPDNQATRVIDVLGHVINISGPHSVTSNKNGKEYVVQWVTIGDIRTHKAITLTMWSDPIRQELVGQECFFAGVRLKCHEDIRELNSTEFTNIMSTKSSQLRPEELEPSLWANLSDFYQKRSLAEIRSLSETMTVGKSYYSICTAKVGEFSGDHLWYESCSKCFTKPTERETEHGKEKYCRQCDEKVREICYKLLVKLTLKGESEEQLEDVKMFHETALKFIEKSGVDPRILEGKAQGEVKRVFESLPICRKILRVKLISSVAELEGQRFYTHRVRDFEVLSE